MKQDSIQNWAPTLVWTRLDMHWAIKFMRVYASSDLNRAL
jgi:hypothetical protein